MEQRLSKFSKFPLVWLKGQLGVAVSVANRLSQGGGWRILLLKKSQFVIKRDRHGMLNNFVIISFEFEGLPGYPLESRICL